MPLRLKGVVVRKSEGWLGNPTGFLARDEILEKGGVAVVPRERAGKVVPEGGFPVIKVEF